MEKMRSVLLIVIGVFFASIAYTMRSFLWTAPREIWVFLTSIGTTPFFILAGIILLICIILIFIFLIFRVSRKETPAAVQKKPEDTGEAPFRIGDDKEETKKTSFPEKTTFSPSELRKNFVRADRRLKANVSGRNYRYEIPCLLMIGELGSGKTGVLDQSGLNLPMGSPIGKNIGLKDACRWWLFENGIVLDVSGDLVLRKDGDIFGSDEKMWHLLLRLLQKHRPKQPTDGVLLTIPCTDIITFGEKMPDMDKIGEKADILYQKLWQIQKILGIRFPVYIVVTKCDQIEGFENFSNETPRGSASNIFGWSSPYAIDAAYSGDWPGKAFQQINESLVQTQFGMFTKGTRAENSDGIFLFPSALQSLAAPLQVYLDRLFSQSVYHESFIFRGLYFCGDKGMFTNDLFDKKIFPEFGIARPVRTVSVSRNRRVISTQIVAALILVIAAMGLWGDTAKLAKDKTGVTEIVRDVEDNVKERVAEKRKRGGLRRYVLLQGPYAKVPFEKRTLDMLRQMSNVWTLRYDFIPSSWFSPIHGEITQTFTAAFNDIILETLEIELLQRTRQVFDIFDTKDRNFDDSAKILAPDQMPEFAEFDSFSKKLRELEENVSLYNSFSSSQNLKSLGKVVLYLYDIDLPADFYEGGEYYLNALKLAQYRNFNPEKDLSISLKQPPEELADNLYKRLFDPNLVDEHLKTLSDQLGIFKQQNRKAGNDDKRIRNLLETISKTEILLARPEISWVFNKSFSLGKPYDAILYIIDSSAFLGPDLRSKIEKTGETKFRELREQLRQKKSELTGQLLEREKGEVMNRLSPAVIKLRADLQKVMKQEFMTLSADSGYDIAIPPGMRLVWDTETLKNGIGYFESYEGFLKTEIKDVPAGLRNTVTSVAQKNMEQKMLTMIAEALSFEPLSAGTFDQLRENDLLLEMRNLREAEVFLNRLLKYFDQFSLMGAYSVMSEILSWQYSRSLAAADRLLEKEILYEIRGDDNFSWWDGRENPPLSLLAFDVSDEKELKYAFQMETKRIQHLAYIYVQPIVAFSQANPVFKGKKEEQSLFKWERILSEIGKYDAKKPENSVTALEKFILFDMDEINRKNYLQKISGKELNERSGDIFLKRRNELRRQLYEQCQRLAEKIIFPEYDEIRTFFDQKLAGRFPFSDITGQTGQGQLTADPEDIRDFYRLLDRKDAATIRNVLEGSKGMGISADHVLEFLSRMDRVRVFFGSYLDDKKEDEKKQGENAAAGDSKKEVGGKPSEKEQVPEFDIDVRFRVSQEHELLANRIIEWKLEVGDQAMTNGRNTGRWQYGEALSFSLRWAKNGLDYPVFAGAHAGIRTEDKQVTYKFDTPWSLLRFLKTYGATAWELDQFKDSKPHTLKFSIDTMRAGTETQAGRKFSTRVFIRVSISDAGKVLEMPVFPEKAPALLKTEKLAN